MESPNLAAIIDLLGPVEFEIFKEEIRAQLREESDLAKLVAEKETLEKEIRAYRVSLAKLETHIRRVLFHYGIPIEKLVLTEEEEPIPDSKVAAAAVAPLPTVKPKPVPPLDIDKTAPEIAEVVRARSANKPSEKERKEVNAKIEECLRRGAPERRGGFRVRDILFYLENTAKLPISTARWQFRTTKNSRIASAVYNHLYQLKLRGVIGREGEYWYWLEEGK
jgi:hypothetical protein